MSNADNSAFTNQLPDHNAMELAASFKKYTSKKQEQDSPLYVQGILLGNTPQSQLGKTDKTVLRKNGKSFTLSTQRKFHFGFQH